MMPVDRTASRACHTAGVLVQAAPAHLPDLLARLESDDDLEVHLTDPPTGRVIVVLQSDDVSTQVERIERLRRLPDVLLAEPVYTRRDDSLDDGERTRTL